MVAGLKQKTEIIMAQIGTFTRGEDGVFAGTINGDGALALVTPAVNKPDAFVYDPANPVWSYGGNVCCTGNAVQAGSFDMLVGAPGLFRDLVARQLPG